MPLCVCVLGGLLLRSHRAPSCVGEEPRRVACLLAGEIPWRYSEKTVLADVVCFARRWVGGWWSTTVQCRSGWTRHGVSSSAA